MTLALLFIVLAPELVAYIGKLCRHEFHKTLHIAAAQTHGHFSYPRCRLSVFLEIVGGKHVNEAWTHFLIREVEHILPHITVVVLYCEIAALVDHRQRPLSVCLIVYKFRRTVIFPNHLVDVLVAMFKQTHKIGRCAGGKPEVFHFICPETVEQTERIINIGHTLAKMIAVISLLQLRHHFFIAHFILVCKFMYWLIEYREKLILGDSA